MKLEKLVFDKFNKDNSGFSIVELVVAVAIMAVIFTPVLRSFTTGSLTNSRAQKLQNATSTAEDVMEEVKGTSIKKLYEEATASDDIIFLSGADATDYLSGGTHSSDSADYDNRPYVIIYKNKTATQGKTYDICVEIDSEPYNKDVDEDSDSDRASGINKAELPQLYDIRDSKDHAVLSWEMSKYDSGAFKNLVEEIAKKDSEKSDVETNIRKYGTKTTTVTFDDVLGYVDITCDVEYSCVDETGHLIYPKTLKYNVYSGRLQNLDPDEKTNSNGGPHAYLFYAMSVLNTNDYFPHEIINIVDNTTSSGTHNAYLMLQNDDKKLNDLEYNNSPKKADVQIWYNDAELLKRSGASFTLDEDDLEDLKAKSIYTNLASADPDFTQGKLYDVKKKDRVYKVKVTVYDGTEIAAENVSSMSSGQEAK